MFAQRVGSLVGRHLSIGSLASRRLLLSKSFQLNPEWSQRHEALTKLALGGDYEWIASVQKKFVGGAASAVDVDAAACGAQEKDQIEDIVDLIYKLRHCENTADFLESTEYAVVRTLLKHDAEEKLFEVLNDPINYGVFLNEHAACLAMDHFITKGNFAAAAKIATYVMLQEMFDNKLVNLMSIYSCLKWVELPVEERVFSEEIHPKEEEEEDINEEDQRTFKFPYLKNEYFDGHFDLTDPEALVGKTLLWVSEHVADLAYVSNMRILGALLQKEWELLAAELEKCKDLMSGVAKLVGERLDQLLAGLGEGQEESPETRRYNTLKEMIEKVPKTSEPEESLSSLVEKMINSIREAEESTLKTLQTTLFKQWNDRRHALIEAQAQRVALRIRLEEIAEERTEAEEEKERLLFFENREMWLDKAAERDRLFKEFKVDSGEAQATEQQYSTEMFEKARKYVERP